MKINNKLKQFLKGGTIALGIILIYEILIFLLSNYLGVMGLFLLWLPLTPMLIITSNLYLTIMSTFILFFIIGGIIGITYNKLKN